MYKVAFVFYGLPITFAVDLRKLVFLYKLSVHAMSTVHVVFFIVAFKECEFLCQKYCVTKGHFQTCVWDSFLACV